MCNLDCLHSDDKVVTQFNQLGLEWQPCHDTGLQHHVGRVTIYWLCPNVAV